MAGIPTKKPPAEKTDGEQIIWKNTKRGKLKPVQPLTQLSIDAT